MYILDSSFLISLVNEQDSNYKKAIKKFSKLKEIELVLIDYVYGETLTVIRMKVGNKYTKNFMEMIEDLKLKINFSSNEIFKLANKIFFSAKELSFVDSIVLATATKSKSQILTFDKQLIKYLDKENDVPSFYTKNS